jgi:hypothetical protein
LPEIVKSQFSGVDFIEMPVNLTQFEYWGVTIGNHVEPRVVPGKVVPVMLSNRVVANARIVDLSATGLAVVLSTDIFDKKGFRVGKLVQVDFRDPGKRNQIIQLKGTVADINVQAKGPKHRVGINTIPEEQGRLEIEAYVSSRKVEFTNGAKA